MSWAWIRCTWYGCRSGPGGGAPPPPGGGPAPGGGPEAAARAARYEAIDRVADGAYVLLGHTRDDQAETVLLGLGRGSGPRSIAGMRPVDGRYLRPLLDIDRSTTVAACAALGLAVWQDPHNSQSRFRRVRVRQEVLPLLEDVLDGGVSRALARTATQLREDLDALDAIAAQVWSELSDRAELDVTVLREQPAAIRSRVVRRWLRQAGVPALTSVHIRSLVALLTDWHGQGAIDLPGGYSVQRRSGRLLLYSRPQ
jgi:tRNA(Ile)-lysidine synthase